MIRVSFSLLAVVFGGVQAQGIGSPPTNAGCDMASLYPRIAALNSQCCGGGGASDCVCTIACASALFPLFDDCRPLLDALLDMDDGTRDGVAGQLDTLHAKCLAIPELDVLTELKRLQLGTPCPAGKPVAKEFFDSGSWFCYDRECAWDCGNVVCSYTGATPTPTPGESWGGDQASCIGQDHGGCRDAVLNGVAQTEVVARPCADTRGNCPAYIAGGLFTCKRDFGPGGDMVGDCDQTCGMCHDGHRLRRMQLIKERCSTDEFAAGVGSIDTACCDDGACDGIPTTCDAKCAITFNDFFDKCSTMMAVMIPDQLAPLTDLHRTCATQLPIEPLLRAVIACNTQ